MLRYWVLDEHALHDVSIYLHGAKVHSRLGELICNLDSKHTGFAALGKGHPGTRHAAYI